MKADMSLSTEMTQKPADSFSAPILLRGRARQGWAWALRGLACALLLADVAAYGHGHNLSTGTLKVYSDHAEAHLVFAHNEIQAILPFDQNGDGVVSPEELANEQQYLDALGPGLAEMSADGEPAKLESVRAVIDANNDVYFDLAFRYPAAARWTFHPGIIKRMPEVHRLFLTVIDPEGKPLGQHYISPYAETLILEKGTVSVPRTADPATVAAASARDPHDDRQGDGLPVAVVVSPAPVATRPPAPAPPAAASHAKLWILCGIVAAAGLLAWGACRITRPNA